MSAWLQNIELEGDLVKLVPLSAEHSDDLVRAASDGKLWELWYTSVPSQETVQEYIKFDFAEKQKGNGFPFAIIEKESGEIIGSTRYCNAAAEHSRVEIGYTWYAKKYQRTGVNTECKYLLLSYAFEHLKCHSVQFKTSGFNEQSRAAILRLGAKQDAILRDHRVSANGKIADTVIFSILANEWLAVKENLEDKIGR